MQTCLCNLGILFSHFRPRGGLNKTALLKFQILKFTALVPVSWKSRKRFGPEKPFVKLRPAYSVKLVFSYVVKGMKIKIKITAKLRASRRLSFQDTKRITSPEMHPKSFGTFEKQTPGVVLPLCHNEYWALLSSRNRSMWLDDCSVSSMTFFCCSLFGDLRWCR